MSNQFITALYPAVKEELLHNMPAIVSMPPMLHNLCSYIVKIIADILKRLMTSPSHKVSPTISD